MAFNRPTLSQLVERVENDFKTALNLTQILRRSVLKALSRVVAGVAHTLFGFIDFAKRQLFPDTAEVEFLERWGAIYGINRLAATFAQLTYRFTGADGSIVPQGTLVQREDGFQYETESEVTISGGQADVTITALESGADGNLDDGTTLTLVSAIAGVDSEGTIQSTVTEGEDTETDEDLRNRILQRIRQPSAGGKVSDYIGFALDVAGVTRVWIFPGLFGGPDGEGTVGVSFVEDNEDPIIPDQAKVDEVQEAVDKEKPITADVQVFAPTAENLDITVKIKPNTQEVRDAVESEITDLINRTAEVRGAIDPEQVALGVTFDGRIPLSKISEAISIAQGEEEHELVSPTNSPQPSVQGGLLVKGTITFQSL